MPRTQTREQINLRVPGACDAVAAVPGFELASLRVSPDLFRPLKNNFVLERNEAFPRYIDVAAWHRPEHNFYSGNAALHDVHAAAEARAAVGGRPARASRTAPQNG